MNAALSMLPSLPSIGQVPTVVWVALGVVALPFAVVFGALFVKLAWGLWPIPLSLGISGYAIYRMGMEWFWLAAIGIAGGIVFTWLWQRTRVFLAGDRRLEKTLLLGD